MRSLFSRLGVLFISLLSVSCNDQVTNPGRTQGTVIDHNQRPFETFDDKLLEIAQIEPAFAGVVREHGRVVVLVTDPSRAGAARDASYRVLQVQGLQTAATRTVKYPFADLYGWKRLAKRHQVLGFQSIDADEALNQVRIGAANSEAVVRIRAALRQAGIPSDAISIVVRKPAKQFTTLHDRVRNLSGGMRILFKRKPIDPNASAKACTLGFNALYDPPGATPALKVFATNSHCSTSLFSMDTTMFYQGTYGTVNDFIGSEAYESPVYAPSSVPACDLGYRCKYTDILLAPYNDANHWDGYYIAKTTNRVKLPSVSGSITIANSGAGLITLVHEISYPLMGDTLDKVGQATGWTAGPVVSTCVDIPVHANFVEFLCQYTVDAGSTDGDSGSAVFYYTVAGDEGTFVGQLWGGDSNANFHFSSLNNIQAQIGNLKVSVYDL